MALQVCAKSLTSCELSQNHSGFLFMQDWITEIITTLGYGGIGLLMFLENIFPPIPSEVIMPLAGFGVLQGKLGFMPTVLAGVTGTMLGTLPWYALGRQVGHVRLAAWADRHGKWLFISARDLNRAHDWFTRYGKAVVFFGRLIPGVRTFISVPAGACRMPLWAFCLYSALGTSLWVGILTWAGYTLGAHYTVLETYMGVISKIVLVSLVLGTAAWLWRRRINRTAQG
jgi:membrane protein DedA with SNARE-associated domain